MSEYELVDHAEARVGDEYNVAGKMCNVNGTPLTPEQEKEWTVIPDVERLHQVRYYRLQVRRKKSNQ